MRFSTREDIALPIDVVFKEMTNFDAMERRALRRGADVNRSDPPTGPGKGSTWEIAFSFRGRRRECHSEVTGFDAPNAMVVASQVGGISGHLTLEFIVLNPKKTRVKTAIDLKPNTLSARLLIQSLKLAKSSLEKRFKSGIANFARQMEDDHRGTRPGDTLA
ncbi:MAG: SRPBCC family protein [Pseudomonadota bacterium]